LLLIRGVAVEVLRPTSTHLLRGGLTFQSDTNGRIGVIAVRSLAALRRDVIAETPASLVVIFALNVEARALHAARLVPLNTKLFFDARFVHLSVFDVAGIKQVAGTVVNLGERVIDTVFVERPNAHAD